MEHANSTGWLDLFAMYGPIVNYHSVDYCFCNQCFGVTRQQLEVDKADKAALDRKKFDMSINTSVLSNVTGGKTKQGI